MKRFAWEPAAKADVRRIKQRQALEILRALAAFARTNRGDVRKLVDDAHGRYRLRVGDWRILFGYETGNAIRIWSVQNRKDAY